MKHISTDDFRTRYLYGKWAHTPPDLAEAFEVCDALDAARAENEKLRSSLRLVLAALGSALYTTPDPGLAPLFRLVLEARLAAGEAALANPGTPAR